MVLLVLSLVGMECPQSCVSEGLEAVGPAPRLCVHGPSFRGLLRSFSRCFTLRLQHSLPNAVSCLGLLFKTSPRSGFKYKLPPPMGQCRLGARERESGAQEMMVCAIVGTGASQLTGQGGLAGHLWRQVRFVSDILCLTSCVRQEQTSQLGRGQQLLAVCRQGDQGAAVVTTFPPPLTDFLHCRVAQIPSLRLAGHLWALAWFSSDPTSSCFHY